MEGASATLHAPSTAPPSGQQSALAARVPDNGSPVRCRAIDREERFGIIARPNLSSASRVVGGDVDTGSDANARRFQMQGQPVPADAVRTEELVNYFRYDHPARPAAPSRSASPPRSR